MDESHCLACFSCLQSTAPLITTVGMPLFRIQLTDDCRPPLPPLDTLPQVEAETPLEAIQQYLLTPLPETRPHPTWARVPVSFFEDGRVKQQLCVPIHVHATIPLKWTLGEQ